MTAEAPSLARTWGAGSVPRPRTRLLGRERELAEAAQLLRRSDVGVLTLIGPGGSGKTRLATELAHRLESEFAGGCVFVALAPLTETADVTGAIAAAFGTQEGAGGIDEFLSQILRDESVLLVLDNFEHLLEAAPVVAAIADRCPNVRILVTSRTRLRISGEFEYPVPPLPLPPRSSGPQGVQVSSAELAAIATSPAVRLFCERAGAAKPGFELTPDTAQAIAEICRRLDGLPLAIELASPRVKVLPPHALLQRIEKGLTFLDAGPRDMPQRQQTLRDTLLWSYRLLTEPEQTLLRRMSVFKGGATLESIEAVCADRNRTGDVLPIVEGLVEKSLLVQRQPGEQVRFDMLETVREFAFDELTASGEAEELQRLLAEHIAALSEEADQFLQSGARLPWMMRLNEEQANIRAALRWCIDGDHGLIAMRILGPLFYWYRLYVREASELITAVLSLPSSQGASLARARALHFAAVCATGRGDIEQVNKLSLENVALSRTIGDPQQLARALSLLGGSGQQSPEEIDQIYEEALREAGRAQDSWLVAMLHMNKAGAALLRGDADGAIPPASESARRFEALADSWMSTGAAVCLGAALAQKGLYAEAEEELKAAIPVLLEMGDEGFTTVAWVGLGVVATETGDDSAAARAFRNAVISCWAGWNATDAGHMPIALQGLAALAFRAGQAEDGAFLLKAARLSEKPQVRPFVFWFQEWAERTIKSLPGGDESTALSVDDDLRAIVERAVGIAERLEHRASTGPGSKRASVHGLTPREVEVLGCLSAGLSNREIAESLVLSVRTVEKHIANIYGKIGARGRVDAAAIAVREGIAPP